jgi:hypothetical protein
MEPPLLRAVLERVILFFVPIALGYFWRWATERRVGAAPAPEMLAAPAAPATRGLGRRTLLWLAATGAVLVAASLIGGVLLPHPPDRSVYVPAEVQPGGGVSQGHFESPGKR